MAVYFSALLKSKALEVYARLPEAEITNYNKLKQALLKRFNLTEEGFRTRFRMAKPEGGETPLQFITRMESYLIRWLELAKMDKTYQGLKTLICHKDLAVFLKERGPVNISELARQAEQYLDAHKSIGHSRQPQNESKLVTSSQEGAAQKPDTDTGRKCYKCDRTGHIARDCRYRASSHRARTATMQEIEDTGSFRGSGDHGFHG